jgi:FkbM family methyltransferase
MPFDVLELALLKVLSYEKQDFYFVQVGANDGVMNDSLKPLVRKYGLRGCLVEPIPDVFNMLKHNYRDQPQLDFRNVMIGERDGDAPTQPFKRDAPVPHEFFHGLARQDANYIRTRAKSKGLENYTETVHCRMVTFESLMADLPVRHVSMLYVDTGASDDKIVDAAFGADVFPPIINYEWTEMPLERRCALKMRLLEHGYRFIDVGADTVCLRVENERHTG